jgi:hypothetical protein
MPVRFASAEDLIIHKLVAGRPWNIEDVTGVLARRPALDERYLFQWSTSFHEVVNRDLTSQFKTLMRDRDPSGIPPCNTRGLNPSPKDAASPQTRG